MKHLLKASIVLLVAVLMSGCNSEERQIKKNAYGYLDATANLRIDDAIPFVTKETAETSLVFLRNVLIPNSDSASLYANTPAKITVMEIRISNDTAYVDYRKETPIKTLDGTIPMIKRDGQWLVHMPLLMSDTTSMPLTGDTTVVIRQRM